MISNLEGRGWVMVGPPAQNDSESVVARYDGEPIKAGLLVDVVEDSEDVVHTQYRTGRYDLEVRVDFEIGRGQVRVEQAEGYDN